MDSLTSIVSSLTPGEIKLVELFYKAKACDDNMKKAKLFKLMVGDDAMSEESAAAAMGYQKNGSSFTNLRQRLRTDILNIMLMQECTSKFATPYAQAAFECRKSLMQGEILLSRGVYDDALDVLDRASRIAQKFQLYGEHLQIEDLVRNHTALKGNINAFHESNETISNSYCLLGKTLDAKKKHYELTHPRLLGVHSLDEYVEKADDIMRQLEALSDTAGSSRIKLYNDLASISYYSSLHEFEKAKHHALAILHAAEKDQVVSSRSNQAGANMELANIYLNTSCYEKAIEHAEQAVGLFKPGMLNQLHAYIILFFAHFRNRNIEDASKVLTLAQNHRMIKKHDHPQMASRVNLLRASFSFYQGDIEKSTAIINRTPEGGRDKEGWMPGYYMLDLLILMEKRSIDLASYKLEAFRKMLHRHGIDKQEMRLSVIARIIKNLVKEDCNYSNALSVCAPEIKKLSEAKKEYYWNPAGYEVIRFDEWILKKVS